MITRKGFLQTKITRDETSMYRLCYVRGGFASLTSSNRMDVLTRRVRFPKNKPAVQSDSRIQRASP